MREPALLRLAGRRPDAVRAFDLRDRRRVKDPLPPAAGAGLGLKMQTPRRRPGPDFDHGPSRRGNYDSGQDYVLEYGELASPSTSATSPSASSRPPASSASSAAGSTTELEDLVNLTVNGEVQDPPRRSASTSTTAGPSSSARPTARSCTGCAGSSSAPPGSTSGSRRASSTSSSTSDAHLRLRPARARRRADRALARAELGPGRLHAAVAAPRFRCWGRGCRDSPRSARLSRSGRTRGGPGSDASGRPAPRDLARALAIASAPASPTSSSGRSVPLAARSSAGKRPSAVSRRSSATTVVSPPSGAAAVAMTVSEPPSAMLRAAASARRAPAAAPSSVSTSTTASPPRAATRRPCSTRARRPAPGRRPTPRTTARPARGRPPPLGDLLGAHAGQHDADLEALAAGERAGHGAAPRSCRRAGRRR